MLPVDPALSSSFSLGHRIAKNRGRSQKASPSFPLVTIAVPTFNRAQLLRDCVRSALAQTYPNFEVVVMDNASTDETTKVLEEFCDHRLRVIRHKTNIGLLENWNACIAQAKGDYFGLLSDDDRMAPWMLRKCMEMFRSDAQMKAVVVLTDIYVLKEKRVVPAMPSRRLLTGVVDGADMLEEFLNHRISVMPCGIIIKTEALRARGGFPVDHAHVGDMAAWAPILLMGKVGFINEPCAVLCVNDSGANAKLSGDDKLIDSKKFIGEIPEVFQSVTTDRAALDRSFKRFFAGTIIKIAAESRRRGTSFTSTMGLLWRWRSDLRYLSPRLLFVLWRQLAILLLPAAVSRWLVSFIVIPANRKIIEGDKNPHVNYEFIIK